MSGPTVPCLLVYPSPRRLQLTTSSLLSLLLPMRHICMRTSPIAFIAADYLLLLHCETGGYVIVVLLSSVACCFDCSSLKVMKICKGHQHSMQLGRQNLTLGFITSNARCTQQSAAGADQPAGVGSEMNGNRKADSIQ